MRKLCIAVIVMSFFGFGPLKSFFHSVMNTNGINSASETIIQKMKNSTHLIPQGNSKQTENFLITEKSTDKKYSINEKAMVLRYDSEKHKIMVGSILLPENIVVENSGNKDYFDTMKKAVEKEYKVSIDHYFTLDTAGLARIIDLLAPKGIILTENTGNKSSVTVDKKINGNELVSVINNGKPEEINAVFSALKNQIKSKQSAEKLVTLAPSILNDAIKSVNT
ncbi:MAG: hypothetical protein ACXVNF_15135, partial [Neobacillus sp.]